MAKYSHPLCKCDSYKFPHKAGAGKCKGTAFIGAYKMWDGSLCKECNCYCKPMCDVIEGLEDKSNGECWQEAVAKYQGEYLPLKAEDFM